MLKRLALVFLTCVLSIALGAADCHKTAPGAASSGAAGANPIATADAYAPNPAMQCHDYFDPPSGIIVHAHNVMSFGYMTFCTTPPASQVATIVLQAWSTTLQQWVNYQTQVSLKIPGPAPEFFGAVAYHCTPGLWRVTYTINAVGPAPNSSQGTSATRTIAPSECGS
jgi:hypothetical protein